MTTQEIYKLAVEMGMKSDLRGKEKVKKYLERFKENMKMDKEAKEDFDAEKLFNPYSDTRVLVDNNKKQIKENFGRCRYGRERRSCSPINWALIWLSLIIRGKATDLHGVIICRRRYWLIMACRSISRKR